MDLRFFMRNCLKKIIAAKIIFLLSIPIILWVSWWNIPNDIREEVFEVFWSKTPYERFEGERPTLILVPDDYDPSKKYPLVVALHGYQSFPVENEIFFGLKDQLERHNFILAMPYGRVKPRNKARFWNAMKDCCGEEIGGDDVGAILSVTSELIEKYPVDPEKVFVFGYSNGGYLAYRIACEDQGLFKGTVVFAGLSFPLESQCKSPTPRPIVHFHGTADKIVDMNSENGGAAPVDEILNRWAKRNNCGERTIQEKSEDFGWLVQGKDTDVVSYENCQDLNSVTFYRLREMGHIPFLKVQVLDYSWPLLLKEPNYSAGRQR